MNVLVSKISITSVVILAAAGLTPFANAQLLTSWSAGCVDDGNPVPNCVNSWLTDVATGQFVGVGSSPSVRNLAADNATGRVFTAGSLLLTFQVGADGELIEVNSEPIVDANGNAFTEPISQQSRFQSLGFANGLLYGTVAGGDSAPAGFYSMDPETAVATLLAPFPEIPAFAGLDYNPEDGLLYAITGGNTAASIVSIDVATLAVTQVADVPLINVGGVSIIYDGVAVGNGKVYLSTGNRVGFTFTPILVYNIASGAFEESLPSPRKSGENGFYFSGATFLDPLVQTIPGDVNCDGARNSADIDAFVLALLDPAQYAIDFPDCDRSSADTNADGVIDTTDVDPFVDLLLGV